MSRSTELANIVRLHQEWLDSGNKSGQRADLSGADLAGVGLSRIDLSGALLRGSHLEGADLRGSTLFHADFSDANLKDASLAEARWVLADFTGADLRGADLSGTHCDAAKEHGHNRRGPRFRDANLEGADLSHAHCLASDFSGAHLRGARFCHARLSQANLSACDLSGLDLSSALLEGANLHNSVLRGADLRAAQLTGANLNKALLVEADISEADLTSASLVHCKVDGIRYNRKTRFRGIRLEGCYGSSRFKVFAQDQDYIEEFKEAHPGYYWVWMVLTDCGRSLMRVVLWSLCLSVLFGLLFWTLGENAFAISNPDGLKWNVFTAVYYSVVTFTTLGFGDITPRTHLAAGLVMAEVVIGYVMLGILISILATKVARRS